MKVKSLVDRVWSLCDEHNVNMMKYILNNEYCSTIKQDLKTKSPMGVDGQIDSLRALFHNYNDHARNLAHQLINVVY